MRSLILVVAVMLVTSSLFAQTGTVSTSTVPVGVINYTIASTSAAQTTITYIALPLQSSPVYTGPVATFSSNTLTLSGVTWTPGQYATAGSPYFVRIATGSHAGRYVLVTANSVNSLTVDTTDHSLQTTPLNGAGFAVAANDRIDLFAGDTLALLFGDNSSTASRVILQGDVDAFSADTIGIFNPITKRNDVYYFNTTLQLWNNYTSTISQNGLVIYPESVLAITRRPSRPQLTFQLQGRVPDVAPLTKTTGNSSVVYGSHRFPVDVTLAKLNIAGWTKNDSPFDADVISIWNQATVRWDAYYQRFDGTWRKSTDATTDQSGVVVPAGTGVQITKRAAVTGTTSFLAVGMPYTP